MKGLTVGLHSNGCNSSGPIPESSAMKSITSDLEEQVSLRLQLEKKREAVSGAPLASPPNAHSFRYSVMKNDMHGEFHAERGNA